MNKNKSDYVLIVMKNLNLLIVLYIAVIMAYSLSGVIREDSAMEFLLKINRLPTAFWKIPAVVLCLYAGCLLLMHIHSPDAFWLVMKAGMEVVISFCISYMLGFGYTGIILLILADIMKYLPKSRWKFSVGVILCMFYLLIDFDFLAVYFDVISFDTYLAYFQRDVHFILFGIKNMLGSLNTFLFLIYVITVMQMQVNENERMLSLNDQLNLANRELQEAYAQLEEYARESEQMVKTRERNRLAREIHDTLGHALTGIITGIEACTVLMDVAPDATKIQMKAIAEVARQGVTDVRRSVNALRPDALDKLDLERAITRTISEMRLATSADIDYQCMTPLNCFSEDEEDIIYRIVQESITNSIRHGKADHIWIQIGREHNMLHIRIRDNGIGCADVKKGFGLHHMEERMGMLNGSLSYDGRDGFVIDAKIPIRWGKGGTQND